MPMKPGDMGAAIAANLPKKTGRTLEQWIEILTTQGPAGSRKERVEWLKREHQLGHVTAEQIVGAADTPADFQPPSGEELLAAQYAGPKAALRPIYDRLAQAARSLGEDVELDPRQTYVSLIRGKQFGIVQPSTRDRVDLGLKLPGVEPAGRLQLAGSVGSGQTTHRLALSAPDEVDGEVLGWLRRAYDGVGAVRRG